MKHRLAFVGLLLAIGCGIDRGARPAEPDAKANQPAQRRDTRAYGEWRIQIRPDKLKEYAELIETKGLPLFREAGGRMVGWWTTMVGNLYEHLTIWEYDSMAAFEQAAKKLGQDERFGKFVALRDPLLAGEQNRFLQLADFAVPPSLPQPAELVVHEIHRVPLARREAYLKFIESDGLSLLKSHGFRVVGPWIATVGSWNEVTYLFCFESLAERDKLRTAFALSPDARRYGGRVSEFAEDVSNRVLVPAPFARRVAESKP